ncbi:hypothetical protein ACP4OV_005392 [Aristida adscensionis]
MRIAGRLHDAADFVRFHAVCRPWRDAPPPSRAHRFHPCLIAQHGAAPHDAGLVRLHSPFSRDTRRRRRPPRPWPVAVLRGKKLESPAAAAASGRFLALGCAHDGDRTAILVNPLTGDATSLPPLPQHISPDNAGRCAYGFVSDDGAVMVHTLVGRVNAAIRLRPGETVWEDIDMAGYDDYPWPAFYPRRAAALCSSGVLAGGGHAAMAELPANPGGDRYMLVSQGELLCVDVQHNAMDGRTPAAMAVSVHALEASDMDDRRPPGWVERKHGRGIDHMCLFLNWVGNCGFAIDAREFTGGEVTGGCAYVVGEVLPWADVVKRYSFKDGTATVVDTLPNHWGFNPLQSPPNLFNPSQTEQGLRSNKKRYGRNEERSSKSN